MRSPSKMAVPAAASVVFKRAPADCRTKPAGAVCPGKAAPKSRHDKAAARRRQLIIVQDLIGKANSQSWSTKRRPHWYFAQSAVTRFRTKRHAAGPKGR